MATLAELAREHTGLDEEQVAHLQDLVGSCGLLADLSFADVLLYARSSPSAGSTLVILAHVRPTTGTTLYRADLVGQVFEPRRRHLVDRAFDESTIVDGMVRVGVDRDIAVVAVPVNRAGETIAVLVRERLRPEGRPSSEQERTYLRGVRSRIATKNGCDTGPPGWVTACCWSTTRGGSSSRLRTRCRCCTAWVCTVVWSVPDSTTRAWDRRS